MTLKINTSHRILPEFNQGQSYRENSERTRSPLAPPIQKKRTHFFEHNFRTSGKRRTHFRLFCSSGVGYFNNSNNDHSSRVRSKYSGSSCLNSSNGFTESSGQRWKSMTMLTTMAASTLASVVSTLRITYRQLLTLAGNDEMVNILTTKTCNI